MVFRSIDHDNLVRALILSCFKTKQNKTKQNKTKNTKKHKKAQPIKQTKKPCKKSRCLQILPFSTCQVLRKFPTIFPSGFMIFTPVPTNRRVPSTTFSPFGLFGLLNFSYSSERKSVYHYSFNFHFSHGK